MTALRDIILQPGISKMKVEPDGSYKRAPSSFLNVIEKGGTFEPEPGEIYYAFFCSPILTGNCIDRYHLYVSYACREHVL
jgi:putative glutathione S-transferase